MITPDQCRAARTLLGWSQKRLASAVGVSQGTISNFESRHITPNTNNMGGIVATLEAAGVVFGGENLDGQSVRLKKSKL